LDSIFEHAAKIEIVGRVWKPPEVRTVGNGLTLGQILVMVERQAGEKTIKTLFRCVCWEEKAAALGAEIAAGDDIRITGIIDNRRWRDKKTNEWRSGGCGSG